MRIRFDLLASCTYILHFICGVSADVTPRKTSPTGTTNNTITRKISTSNDSGYNEKSVDDLPDLPELPVERKLSLQQGTNRGPDEGNPEGGDLIQLDPHVPKDSEYDEPSSPWAEVHGNTRETQA